MQRAKIQLRIIVPGILLLTATVALFISALHSYQVAEERMVNTRIDYARRSLSLLKQELEYHAVQADPVGNTQRLLIAQGLDNSIEALAVINPAGQILANRFASKGSAGAHLAHFTGVPQALINGRGLAEIHLTTDGQSIQAYIPFSPGSLATGTPKNAQALLYASYNLSAARTVLWQQIRRDFQAIWIMSGLFVLVLTLLLEHFVTRPLTKLVEFSQRLATDHSGLQSSERYLGEMATLNHALNTMSNKVARTVRELNTQQENLEVTLHSIGDAVITTDNKGLVTRLNPVAEQLTGWYAYEARGLPLKTIFPIINATTRETIPNPVDKVLATGETLYLSNHTTLIAKDGSELQIADSAAAIRDANDQIAGMILVFNDVTEAYKLRQAARNIQEQVQGLFDDMQTMAGILDPDGTVTFMNNTPLEVMALKPEDVIGKKLWKCAWFNAATEIQANIQHDCLEAATGKKILRDIQINTAEGGYLWVQFSIHPVLDEHGAVIQLVAEGHDISQRKIAEEELSASLQHIKLYREQTPLATIEWNMAFQIEDWNEAASKLFGYTRDEVLGCDASLIVPRSAAPEVGHVWESIIQQSGGEININQNVTKDGRIILCEWHNSAIVDQAGQVVGMASLIQDISAEHEAKLALIKKEQEQREILNALVEGILTVDEYGKVLSINPAAEKIFGYSSEEISDKDLSLIMPNFDPKKVEQYVEQTFPAISYAPLGGLREIVGLRKNKTTFPLQLAVAELPGTNDGTRRFISSCNDLTEEKRQRGHLQRTQKMDALGKIVGGIAHDYNNMLGVILGYADLMAIKYHDIDGLNHYIEQISQAGERGRNLTKRMLDFSKQESSHPAAIELHPTLKAQNELLGKSITALIKLEYKLCKSPWSIWLDSGELEDTLLNLAINARHAMPNGGVLTLATHKRHLSFAEARAIGLGEGDYMELSVSDNGSGISEEIQNRIFDPFFSTKGSEGTGLGLSQAYGFMERCNGTIRVESTPGVGSTFLLYFPRYEGAVDFPADQIEKFLIPHVNAEKILIVDDEPALRELTREILSIAGYSVLIAGNASAALAILEKESVDLMISDIIMPKMNGYDLAKIVKTKYPLVKIQLASGYSSNQAIADDQQYLHSSILHKPFRSAELLSTVAALLETQDNAH